MTLEEFKEIMKRRGTDEIIESLKNGKIESYEIINEILKQKLSGRNPERRLVVEADKFKHIWGVTYSDISELDLSGFSKEEMLRLNFSLLTKWPSKDKMPEGFNPEKIIEERKHFKGFGIDKLHEKGIDGTGVTIAYIDTPFNFSHEEFKGLDLECKQTSDPEFHGTSVSARVIGQNSGVAPKAKYIFYGQDRWLADDFCESCVLSTIKVLEDIIQRVEEGEKFDVVGESATPLATMMDIKNESNREELKQRYLKAVKRLEELNVTYINSGDGFWKYGFAYAFKVDPTKDSYDLDNYVSLWNDCVCVQEADRVVPCAFDNSNYKYENQMGCASWSIPQVVGLFALAKQVNKDITLEEFSSLAKETATEANQYGVRFINPCELIKAIQKLKENKEEKNK